MMWRGTLDRVCRRSRNITIHIILSIVEGLDFDSSLISSFDYKFEDSINVLFSD